MLPGPTPAVHDRRGLSVLWIIPHLCLVLKTACYRPGANLRAFVLGDGRMRRASGIPSKAGSSPLLPPPASSRPKDLPLSVPGSVSVGVPIGLAVVLALRLGIDARRGRRGVAQGVLGQDHHRKRSPKWHTRPESVVPHGRTATLQVPVFAEKLGDEKTVGYESCVTNRSGMCLQRVTVDTAPLSRLLKKGACGREAPVILAESGGATDTGSVIIVWPYYRYLPLVFRNN